MKQKSLLRRYRYILKKLASSNSKNRKIILKNAPSELFTVLKLILKLIADKKLNLSRTYNQKLIKYQSFIHSTAPLKGKQIRYKLLKLSDTTLSSILKTVIPALRGVLSAA